MSHLKKTAFSWLIIFSLVASTGISILHIPPPLIKQTDMYTFLVVANDFFEGSFPMVPVGEVFLYSLQSAKNSSFKTATKFAFPPLFLSSIPSQQMHRGLICHYNEPIQVPKAPHL